MKRLAALFLIFLFLFNLVGYRLFFEYIQTKADAHYAYALDRNDFDESSMITLKVDLDMPYLAQDTDFERVGGEITVAGVVYKYVKRKIHNGQLVLLCLPDQKATQLKSARDKYFSIANNLASDNDSSQTPPKDLPQKGISTDYEQFSLTYFIGFVSRTSKFQLPLDEAAVSSAHRGLPAQPPESA